MTVPTLAPPRFASVAGACVLSGLCALAAWAIGDLRINVATMVDSAGNAADFAQRMVPLDFPPLGELVGLIAKTLSIVVCATLLSVVIGLALAVLAAGNTNPRRGVRFGASAVSNTSGLVRAARLSTAA